MDAGHLRQGNLADVPLSARLRWGVIFFGSGILLGTVALELHASRWELSGLFVPFLLGANGIFMGLYRTCTPLAVGGLRDLGCGSEKIANEAELRAVRGRAIRATVCAFVMAAVATGSLMLAAR